MAKMCYKVVVRKLADTHFGKLLLTSAEARKRYEKIVHALREDARPEIEMLERSQRLTWDDLHRPTFY